MLNMRAHLTRPHLLIMSKSRKKARTHVVAAGSFSSLPRITASSSQQLSCKNLGTKRVKLQNRTENVLTTDTQHFDPPENAHNYEPTNFEEPSPLPVIVTSRRGGKVHCSFLFYLLFLIRRLTQTQHDFLAEWMEYQEEYLSVLLSHEAPPLRLQSCHCRSGASAIFACSSCHGTSSHCGPCIISLHHWMPLHRIKKWNGSFMEEVSLSQLGLITFFGHGGALCPMVTQICMLTILHIDGFHNISVGYCGCGSSLPPHLQLFDGKLFSASIGTPKTAFTFELLRQYQIHHLEGKGSAYSYIRALYRLTNDEGLSEIPVRRIALHKDCLTLSLGSCARV
jgi:hypothetical protein